ncbi:hypothetical protein [Longispora urticae]
MIGVMEAQGWLPVLEVKAGETVLAVGADGRWLVGRDEATARLATEWPTWLLPLLERPYREVAATPLPAGAAPPPWADVVRRGLTWPTAAGYWQGLALCWLEEGHPIGELAGNLLWLNDAQAYPRPVRHRALRLWRTVVRPPASGMMGR